MSKALRIVIGVALVVVGIWYPPAAPYGAQLIMGGAMLALGAILEKSMSGLNRLRGQSVMIRSAVLPQERVYGLTRKSGVVTWYDTSGDNNKYLWFVVTVCEHEIEEYTKLWIDEVEVDISTEIDGSGYVTNAAFINADGDNLVKTGFYLGAASQTADAELVAAFSEWSIDHKGNDCAYFWARIETDTSKGGNDPENPGTNVWYKGWPRDLSVTIKGAKVYDPRLDDLNGGTGTHRVDTESTWEWSENSVLCRTDYLRSDRFGSGYTSSDIDWAVVATEADYCEDLVSLPDSATQARYTTNGVISMQDTPSQIIQSMQSSDYGTTLFKPGSIEVLAGGWEASSHTIDSTWVAGSFAATSADSADSAYNAVRGQYSSLEHDYSVVEFNPRTSSAYETEDGVGRVWRDILLPFTTDELRAQRMAILNLKKSRQQTTLTVQCNFRAELVEIYQVVTVDLPGISSETFRVVGKSSSTDGTISLQLREEVSTDWDYTVPELAAPPIIPTVSRPDAGPPPPSNLAATTITGGILLTWDLPALAGISHIEVYSSASDARAAATLIHKTVSESFFHEQGDGVVNYYWILARGFNGLTSIWEPNTSAGIEGTAGTDFGVPDFAPGYIGGTSDFVYALNVWHDFTPNDGEIRVEGNTFRHPDGTNVTLATSPMMILTHFELATTGKFYIMYSATVGGTRFGGGTWGTVGYKDERFIRAVYDETNGWRAVDIAGTYFTMTVVATDCIIAICEKTAATGGINTIQVLTGGTAGADAVKHYIKPVDGTAIKNGTGTLTIEAHEVIGGTDSLLSSGTIVLYDPLDNIVNVANGYAIGSDGYTGVLDAGDINDSKVITLKDGVGGTVLDTITLVDIADGGAGFYGYIEASNGLAWTRSINDGAWNPVATTTILTAYFVSSGVSVGSYARTVTRSTAGLLTATGGTSGDITCVVTNNNTQAITLTFTYDDGTDAVTIGETVLTSIGGSDGDTGATGDTGPTGANGLDGITYIMSNESSGISADSVGAVVTAGLANTGTTLRVLEGTTALTFETGVLSAGEFKVNSRTVRAPTGMTVPALTGDATTTATAPSLTGWTDTTAATGYINWEIGIMRAGSSTEENFTIKQTFTITRDGAAGGDGGGNCVVNGGSVSKSGTTPWAQWAFSSDGDEYTTVEGGSATSVGTWLLSGSATDYDIYVSESSVSGDGASFSFTGTLDAWQDLVSTRSFRLDAAAGEIGAVNYRVDIRNNSTKVNEASGFFRISLTDTT